MELIPTCSTAMDRDPVISRCVIHASILLIIFRNFKHDGIRKLHPLFPYRCLLHIVSYNHLLTILQTLTIIVSTYIYFNNFYQSFSDAHLVPTSPSDAPHSMGKDVQPLRQSKTAVSKTSCDIIYDIDWEIMTSDIAKVHF